METVRRQGNWYRKYTLDQLFFQKVDSEEKAYWLGFLYADGSLVDGRYVRILLNTQDKDHLVKFTKSLNTNQPVVNSIYNRPNPRPRDKTEFRSYISIGSTNMYDDLVNLGCLPRKTFTLDFPNSDQVPTELIHHFIRGYFDGDGTVYKTRNKNRKTDRWCISIISTTVFIFKCADALRESAKIKSIRIRNNATQGISSLEIKNIGDVNRFRDFVLKDANIYLDRKYVKLKQIPIQYFSSKKAEVLSTLIDKIKSYNLIEFSAFDIQRLFDVSQQSSYTIIERAIELNLIKKTRTDKNNRTIYYNITNEQI